MTQIPIILERLFCIVCGDTTLHIYRVDGMWECLECRCKSLGTFTAEPDPGDKIKGGLNMTFNIHQLMTHEKAIELCTAIRTNECLCLTQDDKNALVMATAALIADKLNLVGG